MNKDNDNSSGPLADKRAALLDKISGLLAKTKDRGCTEAEAFAAAELASKLMAKYGLTLGELEAIQSPVDTCEADGAPIGNRRAHEVLHVSNAIARYTNTETWYQRHGIIQTQKYRLHEHHGVLLIYFGLPADVQVAIYLTNTLQVAMDCEWTAYWRANKATSNTAPRTARNCFMRGMAHRLGQRLDEMKKAQSKAAKGDSRAIVIVKERIVNEAFHALDWVQRRDKRRPSFRAGRPNYFAYDGEAMSAGVLAADRVTIASGALETNK